MIYEILSNKLRPQSFNQIIGQKYVVKIIINSLKIGRIHHSWLLSGTRGIGKTTLARMIAKSLNCELGITYNPCRKCTNCMEIELGKHVDFIEVDAASKTKVEEIKTILDTMQYFPMIGRFKIYLIDEVHMLSRHSFNALLKTLEEPLNHIKFILATTEPDKLPLTIKSRCLQLKLKPISSENISIHLQNILKSEKIDFEIKAIKDISKFSAGSMRDAITTLELIIISLSKKKITCIQVNKILGLLDIEVVLIIIEEIFQKNIKKIFSILLQLENKGIILEKLITKILYFFHKMALIKIINEKNNKKNKSLFYKKIYSISKKLSFKEIQEFQKILIEGTKNLKYMPSIRIGIEIIFLQIIYKHQFFKKNK